MKPIAFSFRHWSKTDYLTTGLSAQRRIMAEFVQQLERSQNTRTIPIITCGDIEI